uniref:RNA-directed RNA polymerase L n=2 Tax=Bunyaviricetes TaxID=3151693 RepID=A0A023J4K4_9VIRU|nr:L [Sclerotinia sclerotiorum phlebo-like virus 1] [Sclerotinia sclerotiorum phlebo-like virus 1]AHF48633.1 RNA-dependent RNA polymerase [Sclerotinia sclerotiorum negative-stranded RNA virus 5]
MSYNDCLDRYLSIKREELTRERQLISDVIRECPVIPTEPNGQCTRYAAEAIIMDATRVERNLFGDFLKLEPEKSSWWSVWSAVNILEMEGIDVGVIIKQTGLCVYTTGDDFPNYYLICDGSHTEWSFCDQHVFYEEMDDDLLTEESLKEYYTRRQNINFYKRIKILVDSTFKWTTMNPVQIVAAACPMIDEEDSYAVAARILFSHSANKGDLDESEYNPDMYSLLALINSLKNAFVNFVVLRQRDHAMLFFSHLNELPSWLIMYDDIEKTYKVSHTMESIQNIPYCESYFGQILNDNNFPVQKDQPCTLTFGDLEVEQETYNIEVTVTSSSDILSRGFTYTIKETNPSLSSEKDVVTSVQAYSWFHKFCGEKLGVKYIDDKLSQICPLEDGYNDYSPDVIHKRTVNGKTHYTVVEFFTRHSGNKQDLGNDLKKKYYKYQNAISARIAKLGCTGTYLVIGINQNHVVSNGYLSDSVLLMLRERYRAGEQIMSEVIRMSGENWFVTKEDNQSYHKARKIIQSFILNKDGEITEDHLKTWNKRMSPKSILEKKSLFIQTLEGEMKSIQTSEMLIDAKLMDHWATIALECESNEHGVQNADRMKDICIYPGFIPQEVETQQTVKASHQNLPYRVYENDDKKQAHYDVWRDALWKVEDHEWSQEDEKRMNETLIEESELSVESADIHSRLNFLRDEKKRLKEAGKMSDSKEVKEITKKEDDLKDKVKTLNEKKKALKDKMGTTFERGAYKRVKVDFSDVMRKVLGELGVQGKEMKDDPYVKKLHEQKKKSLSPETSTSDIDGFLYSNWFMQEALRVRRLAKELVDDSAKMMGSHALVDLLESCIDETNAGKYSKFVSNLTQELAANRFIGKDDEDCFHVKKMRNWDCTLLIKCTRGMTFFSVGCENPTLMPEEYDDIFTKPYEESGFYFTPFRSIKTHNIDHHLKTESKLAQCVLTAKQLSNTSDSQFNTKSDVRKHLFSDPEFLANFNLQWIIYLENKTQTEEVVTLSRYVMMRCITNVNFKRNSHLVLNKCSRVFRSRLQLWLTKKLAEFCSVVNGEKGRLPYKDRMGKFVNIYNPFTGQKVIRGAQLVIPCYFGYLVSKIRPTEKNSLTDMLIKITEPEREWRDIKKELENNKDIDGNPRPIDFRVDDHKEYKRFVWDKDLMNMVVDSVKEDMKRKFGLNWEARIERLIITSFAKSKFEDIATTKASSNFDPNYNLVLSKGVQNNYLDYVKRLRLRGGRPRVVSAIILFVEEVEKKYNVEINDLIDLLPYANKKLQDQKHLLVDLFKKEQHGGLREIYVMEIAARVVQYFNEKIGRILCGFYESEIMTSPKNKYLIPINHSKTFKKENPNSKSLTFGYAADAAKWNQNHHVDKFIHMLVRLLPPLFSCFIASTIHNWIHKRIQIPVQILECINNSTDATLLSKPELIKLRAEHFGGENLHGIHPKNTDYVDIESGMMQGIFHFISSALHTFYQEWLRKMFYYGMEQMGLRKPVISLQQSSDDSSMIVSWPHVKNSKTSKSLALLTKALFNTKDVLGLRMGIRPSIEKSVSMLMNSIEFNSEFFFDDSWVRPTNRWTYVTDMVQISETFQPRYESFSNSLSDYLAGGGDLISASVLQRYQGRLHYMMLGEGLSPFFAEAHEVLLELRDPGCGYFIMSPTSLCGLLPFTANYYFLIQQDPNIRKSVKAWYDDSKLRSKGFQPSIGQQVNQNSIKFGGRRKYEPFLESLSRNIPSWENDLDKNPGLAFRKAQMYKESRLKFLQQYSNPGIAVSMNQTCPLYKEIAAGVYKLHQACWLRRLAWSESLSGEKTSLLRIMKAEIEKNKTRTADLQQEELDKLFPNRQYYDHYWRMSQIYNKGVLVSETIRMRSRAIITIVDHGYNSTIPILELASFQFFGEPDVPMTEEMFTELWEKTKVMYPFLGDSAEETKNKLGADHYYEVSNYLQSFRAQKDRELFLTSTTAKTAEGLDAGAVITRIMSFGCKLRVSKNVDFKDYLDDMKRFDQLMVFLRELPLDPKVTKREIRSMFDQMPMIGKAPLELCSKRASTLSIMSKVVREECTTAEALNLIERTGTGALSYFDPEGRQTRDDDTKDYKGKGVLRIKIRDCYYVIVAQDSEITLLACSRIDSKKTDEKVLATICKSLKWSSEAKGNGVQMSFNGTKFQMNEGCPVIEDQGLEKNFRMDKNITLKLTHSFWKDGTSVRLTGGGITFLSYSVDTRNYDFKSLAFKTKEKLLSLFTNGNVLKYDDLMEELWKVTRNPRNKRFIWDLLTDMMEERLKYYPSNRTEEVVGNAMTDAEFDMFMDQDFNEMLDEANDQFAGLSEMIDIDFAAFDDEDDFTALDFHGSSDSKKVNTRKLLILGNPFSEIFHYLKETDKLTNMQIVTLFMHKTVTKNRKPVSLTSWLKNIFGLDEADDLWFPEDLEEDEDVVEDDFEDFYDERPSAPTISSVDFRDDEIEAFDFVSIYSRVEIQLMGYKRDEVRRHLELIKPDLGDDQKELGHLIDLVKDANLDVTILNQGDDILYRSRTRSQWFIKRVKPHTYIMW